MMSRVRRPHGRLFQIRGPAAPKLLSPKLLCIRGTAHVIRERPTGSSVAFGDEIDIISQVRRHLTAQCLAHQTGEFELHSPPNRKPVVVLWMLRMSEESRNESDRLFQVCRPATANGLSPNKVCIWHVQYAELPTDNWSYSHSHKV